MSAVVMDSSAWLTFFEGSGNADVFEDAILAADPLIVPSICLAEVFKVLLRQVDVALALRAVAQMRLGEVVDLDADLALAAASAGIKYKLPMADSIVYATAQKFDAVLWTQDADFSELPNVHYYPAKTH